MFRQLFLRAMSVVAIYGVLAACGRGSGDTQMTIPAQVPQSGVTPAFEESGLHNPSAGASHYLYLTSADFSGQLGGSKMFVYALPLTATSKPIKTIPGFSYPTGLAVGEMYIIVADLSRVSFYYRTGASAYMRRCTFTPSLNGLLGVDLYTANLFATGNAFVDEYANNDGTGTPLPCTGESPIARVSKGVYDASTVAATDKVVYVGNHLSITEYAQPFRVEAPMVTLPDTSGAVSFVLTGADLYVMNYLSGRIDEYKLPLSDTSTPIVSTRLPACNGKAPQGWGITAYPPPSSGVAPQELFATPTTFKTCDDVYTYKLPLTSTSKPTVVTPIPAGYYPLSMATR